MRIHASVFVTALLLVPTIAATAGEPLTIPIETHKIMKKGKKLNLVWRAPGFDGSKGFQLGKLSNESEDEASSVLQDFPTVLRLCMRAGSPYTLHLAVIGVRTTEKSGGDSSARVDVEGRVVDQGGTLVAAFETRGSATIGGNKRDNIRFATSEIAFGIAKDVFPAGLSSNEKDSAVIVAASPSHEEPSTGIAAPPADGKPSAIIAAAPAITAPPAIVTPPSPAPPASIQAVPSEADPPKEAAQPLPIEAVPPPAATIQSPPQVAPPKPNPPAVTAKASLPEALPSSITGNMKRGSALDMLWISPTYDKASGFSIGEVRYFTDQRDDTVSAYLPDALAELSKKDAPCFLNLGITRLTNRMMIGRAALIRMKAEGRLVSKDGTIVAAFSTSESVQTTDDISSSYRQLARKVVLAIGKDLR